MDSACQVETVQGHGGSIRVWGVSSSVFRLLTVIKAGRRAVSLARWIIRSVPVEIVGNSGHEKVPTRGKPGLERPGRPRGEKIQGSCGNHLWTPQ
ncbi:hypothetical protein TNCV_1148691 [Trichonephila clavipes]|nr:hypothetical protein TNCV_1148691 [Trichonephila clavipes]